MLTATSFNFTIILLDVKKKKNKVTGNVHHHVNSPLFSSNFYFSANDSPSKTMKNVYFI